MKRLIVLVLVFSSHAVLAQDQGGDEEEGPVSGAASLGYLSTSGNTESTNLNAAFNLKYLLEVWNHEFALSAIRATNDNVRTAEAYGAKYAGRRELGMKGYLVTSLDYTRDEFSSYETQTSETVGYGRRFVENDRHNLLAELAAGARQADLIDGTSQDEAVIRGLVDYTLAFGETSQFKQSLVIESGDSNTRTESVSELRAKLIGDVAVVLSYRIRNNSDVLPGTEKTDTFSAISFEYSF